ncbi:MAG: ATP-binding protein [Oculatellaceae cyanobacterium bins.114]|nr:ATP-binding protein [Oculatellaceae cyanobacterium bins.114]
MTQDAETTVAETLFIGGGEMGALMRSYDWSKTPFGAVEQWPQSLRSALSICLNSRFPIAIYWGSSCLLLYNDAWRPIVGDKHPWSLGRPGQEVWSEIWDDIGPEFASVLATGEGIFHNDELLAMHRFGYTEECFFDYTFSPIQGEGGTIDGVFNVVSETTYRVLSDRRTQFLREMASKTGTAKTVEETCRLMTEALKTDPTDIPIALIYLIDADGNYARLCNTPEVTLDSSVAPRAIALTEESQDSWLVALTAQTAQAQVVDDLERRFGKLSGSPWSEPPQEAMVLPISGSGQAKLSGVLVAVASPRRRLDDHYRDFLGQVARQIATAIANARSYEEERQRAEQLAELDRAKTLFFSNISHEFRTPLTLMLGPAEDALQDAQDAEQRDRLELIHRNALRLQKLVNTLLDFSRIEAGRIEATYQLTDLATLTADLAGVFRAGIERAGMRLQVDCPPLPEPVYVDRDMWEKIVLNLLSNAFKFTFEGEIRVRLHWGDRASISPHDSASSYGAILEVCDTGAGIPPHEVPHIFERFHRVQGARGRTYEGSGIGLSLVQELVKLHGGTIQVHSVVEQGTCFTVTIPAGSDHLPSHRIEAPHTAASTAIGAAPYIEEALRWLPEQEREGEGEGGWIGEELAQTPQSMPSSAHRPRLLLADDNADMRDYLKRLLSQHYDVEAIADGVAVLAAIRQQMPDLLLTDVMMPGLNGFELLRSLRADQATQDLPIILLSARAGEEARIEGLAAGADDYLTKPFSARELLARVEATLKLSHLRHEVNAAIQRSEERSRLAIQIAQLGTWRYDPKTQLVELDKRMCEIWGEPVDAAVLPLSQVMQRIHPDDRTLVAHTVGAALDPSSSGMYEIDYRIVWNDGTERWILANGQALFVGEGENRQVIEFLGTALDISDRKQAETALKESQALFEAFMRYSPATAFIKDETGRYLYVNPLNERLCNRPLADWVGKTDFDLFPADEAQQWHHNDLAALASEQAIEIAETRSLADGEHHFISYKFPIPQTSEKKLLGGMSLDVTARYHTEMALRESEERLRLASEGANLGMWYWDVEADTWIWTDRAKAMFGLPIDTQISMQVFLEAVHPDDRAYVQTIVTDLKVGQVHTEGEYRTQWADGTVRWILARGDYSYSADGTLTSTRGVFMDITERKRMEQALRDSEASFRLIVESAKDYAIFTQDLDGYITRWNSGAERLLGYTEADIVGQLGHVIFTPEDRDRQQPEQEMYLALTQERAENERWYVRQDGSRFLGSGLMMPLRDEVNCIQGFLKIMQDKTAERQAAQALQEGSDRLRLLYETVSDLLSTEEPMTLMNTLYHKLSAQMDLDCYYHFMLTEHQGQQMLHLKHSNGISDADAKALAWIELGQALCGLVALERRQITLNQAQIFTHPNAQGICSMGATAYAGQPLIAQGRLLGTLSFISRRRTQFTTEEINLLQAISDQVAVALDRAALVDSLQQQREQLIQANRIKDEFLAVVSHELRSPLNPILGWSRLLQTQQFDQAKTAQALSIIERNAKLQAELINDLLDVSRILQGKLSLNTHPVDLASTIQAALETVRLAAETKSIQLETRFAPNVGFVAGDASRLQQIVWNLLSNAVKFTPDGGRVEVKLESYEVSALNSSLKAVTPPSNPKTQTLQRYAQITVTDTGKGIPPEFLPHVFEYFRQADATTTRKLGGLGLGLAIVRYLAELHGGTVQAESSGENQGATFTVKLPLMSLQPAPTADTSSSDQPLDLHDIRVLVVDDDDSTREFIAFLLNLRGATVTAVASASDAIAALVQVKPDVLLSDIGMPEMDGYMLMRQVRTLSSEQGGQVPAIALTAYAGEINHQQAIAAGFQKHISKPVEPEQLIEAIASLVRPC